MFFHRLNKNVAGFRQDRLLDDRIGEFDDGRLVGEFFNRGFIHAA